VLECQVQHYLALLVEGKDLRDEGISWVVKSLWLLGQEVPASLLPQSLDRDAIKFVYKKAKKELEIDELGQRI